MAAVQRGFARCLLVLVAAGAPMVAPAALEPTVGLPPIPIHRDNPTTEPGVELGRRLFYDPRLSRTGAVACATCHEQEHAFTIPESLPTRGVTGRALARHPPSLVNLAWAETGLFWDGGGKNLESLVLAPLLHEDELGRDGALEELLLTLSADAEYPALFAAAFGERPVSIQGIMKSVAQFLRSIVSRNARWDESGGGPSSWSPAETRGRAVFARDCASCHTPGLFTDGGYHNNGLDPDFGDDPEAPRRGRGRITFAASDMGKYRTPSLRNVALTAPYMHDGRFASLRDVIAHYRRGMVASASVDARFLRAGRQPGITMSDAEAFDLEAFLGVLSDPSLIREPRYANPFVRR